MCPHNCLFWLSTGFRFCKLRNVISYGAKMVVKWPIIPIIDPAPFQSFAVARKNIKRKRWRKQRGPRKKKRGKEKIRNGQSQKNLQILAKAHAPNLFIIQLHFAEYK